MTIQHFSKLAAAVCLLLPAWATADGLAQNDSKPETKSAEQTRSERQPLKKLSVRVLDPDRNPVAGAHVGLAAHFGDVPKKPSDADADGFVYEWPRLTDSKGVAEIEAGGADLQALIEDQGIVAREDKRHLVAIVTPDAAKLKDELVITLAPECLVSGKVASPELKKDEKPLGSTTVSLGDGD